MNGSHLIGCTLMILLLLPVLVLHAEKRVVADRFYGLIALGGLGFAGLVQGLPGLMIAALAGLGCLMLLSSVIAVITLRWRLRLLTGGHIKLLAAGATWLDPGGALRMLGVAVALFLLAALFLRVRKAGDPRPDMAAIATVALLSAQLMA